MKETQTQDGFKSFKGFSNSSKRLTCFNIAIALIFVLLLVPQVFAILPNGNVKIFAVTDDHKGMSADLFIYTIPGTGRAAFITSSSLVGKDTQTTGNIALQIAEKLTREKLTDKDIVFDIRANATEVDGPSAGAAMTLLTYSMYSEKPIPEGVAITGTINNDGSVGMVGGVGPKAQAAAKTGIKLFMIPTGEAVTELDDDGKFETVNLLEYGPRKLGIKVVEVSTITQAIEYAYMNFDDIIVDSNIALQTFIPAPIKYDDILLPMRKISETYISNATTNVDNAKKALDQSTLVESELADYYVKYGATRRGVEMSKRFLDQNYLYSAANYAFSSSVMAITINEIALNPTLLSENSNLLSSKISVLEAEINLVKQKSEFFSMDRFEWIIGAQQRLAYAKNAIDKINNTQLVTVDVPADSSSSSKDAQKQLLFDKVYEYASAKAWVGIAKEFLAYAQSSGQKKTQMYSTDFSFTVKNKLDEVKKLIDDTNSTHDVKIEAERRLASAKISFDGGLIFAALYDVTFAESFILAENARKDISVIDLNKLVGESINEGSKSDSIWANMYFDHAKFFYQNAMFNDKLGRSEDVLQSLETSYDLIFLGKSIGETKNTVEQYLAFNTFNEYVEPESVPETKVGVSYTVGSNSQKLLISALLIILALVLIVTVLVFAAKKARSSKFTFGPRREKLKTVLGNLDKALSKKKVSASEYFLIKKNYQSELNENEKCESNPSGLNKTHSSFVKNIPKESLVLNSPRKKSIFSLDDLRAKKRALERGLTDLNKHYKQGLIIQEDFEKHKKQVLEEISGIKAVLHPTRGGKDQIKGTEELIKEEEVLEEKEKAKRKKIIRRFYYKK